MGEDLAHLAQARGSAASMVSGAEEWEEEVAGEEGRALRAVSALQAHRRRARAAAAPRQFKAAEARRHFDGYLSMGAAFVGGIHVLRLARRCYAVLSRQIPALYTITTISVNLSRLDFGGVRGYAARRGKAPKDVDT